MLNVWNQLLFRVQNRLYTDYDWPHMLMEEDIVITAGTRYSTFVVSGATAGMNWDRVRGAWIKFNAIWREIQYGITSADYNVSSSENGVVLDPIQKWMRVSTGAATYGSNGQSTAPTEQRFEVWPSPRTDTTLRFRGLRKLGALGSAPGTYDDTYLFDLDDQLVVLYAAAELLAKLKSSDADAKLKQANAHYLRLKGNADKSDTFVMGGAMEQRTLPKPLYGGRL